MANALESASLVMIPSGYEDGTLGSLKPTDGTGDFTFSRGSDISATRVNADGYIEKGYENLLLQSNTFSDAAWSKTRTSVTSGQNGYDGSSDAWLLECNEGTANVSLQQSLSSSSVVTYSVYAKAGTTNWLNIRTEAAGKSVWFDLANGVTGTEKATTIASKIESVGNGWYRLSIVFDSCSFVRFYVVDGNNSFAVTLGANIYIQDAMVNQGLVAYPYKETTTAPVAGGILEDMPRLDYSNGSCPSLKLEPQRTNLAPYSEYIEGLALTDLTATPNATTSPEGLQNAYKMLTGTAGGEQIAYQATGTSGNTKTQSVYIKADSGVQWIRLIQVRSGFSNSASTHFDIQNGVKGAKEENGTTSVVDDATKIEDAGNGWYRLTLVCTDSTNNANFDTRVRTAIADGSGTRVSNGSYFVWGYQMESDATYPTSYIPTYGVSQTRLRDSAIASVINTTSRTYFLDGKRLADEGIANTSPIYDPNDALKITFWSNNRFRFRFGGQINYYYTLSGDDFKIALSYNGTDSKIFINGQLEITQTSFDLGNLSVLSINGNESISYNQLLLFPTALTDSECIELTTI